VWHAAYPNSALPLDDPNQLRSVGQSRRHSLRRRCGGFTLVEIMVAVSVILIAVAGTLASQLSAQRLNLQAAETAAAMADLQTCMEEILLLPVEEIPVAESEFADRQPIAAYEGLHLTGERITASYPDYDGGAVPDPLEIVLTNTWRDSGGSTRTVQLSCMKAR